MFLIDRLAVDFIHNSTMTGGIFEYLMSMFAVSFNNEILGFIYAFGLIFVPWSPLNLLLCLLVIPLDGFLTYFLKRILSRPRPGLCPKRFEVLIFDFRGREKNHSLPSGDSMQAASFWMIMAYFGVVPGVVAIICAGLTMLARVYYMCHYPTDTIFGAFLGVLSFIIIKNILSLP